MIFSSEFKNETGFKSLLENMEGKKPTKKETELQIAVEKYEEGIKEYQSRIVGLLETIEFKENSLLRMSQQKNLQANQIESLKQEL